MTIVLALPPILCAFPQSQASSPAPAVVTDGSKDIDDELFWIIMKAYMELMCIILGCDEPVPAMDVSTAVTAQEAALRSQIDLYRAHGLRPGLSPAQLAQGAADASHMLAFIQDNPGHISSDLEAAYTAMLMDILTHLN